MFCCCFDGAKVGRKAIIDLSFREKLLSFRENKAKSGKKNTQKRFFSFKPHFTPVKSIGYVNAYFDNDVNLFHLQLF